MAEGWVKLYRSLLESPAWANKAVARVWLYCLLRASHAAHDHPVGFQEVHLEPGQFVFGRRDAALKTGLSEQTIRSAMNALRSRHSITTRATNRFTIVTICQWERYQQSAGANNQPANQETTNNQPRSNMLPTTNKNVKKGKNGKKKPPRSFEELMSDHPNLNTPTFREKWAEWVQHRSEIRHALKPTTVQAQIRALARDGHDMAIAKMDYSMAQGYIGLVAPEKPTGKTQGQETFGELYGTETDDAAT